MIEAIVYSSCTSCRKTNAFLQDAGAAFRSRDFFKERFTFDELNDFLDRLTLSPLDILSKRSKVYKARQHEIDGLDEGALVSLMIDEPTLLKRPIVVEGDTVIIGHNPVKLQVLID